MHEKPTRDRLQKVLARAGVASRRAIEQWIEAGRISVNGEQATLGQKVGTKDRIHIDGRRFHFVGDRSPVRVIAYHKPIGQVCTRSDQEQRATVFDALPNLDGSRWISIGRLDINTAGLLLFTNDGDLANHLMHPSNQVQREYAVRALGVLKASDLERLTRGIQLEDGIARFHSVRVMEKTEGANQWYRVVLTEGKKREVRRLFEAVGLKVNRLIRVRFGDIQLKRGHAIEGIRDLSPGEIKSLYLAAGLPPPLDSNAKHQPSKQARRRHKKR